MKVAQNLSSTGETNRRPRRSMTFRLLLSSGLLTCNRVSAFIHPINSAQSFGKKKYSRDSASFGAFKSGSLTQDVSPLFAHRSQAKSRVASTTTSLNLNFGSIDMDNTATQLTIGLLFAAVAIGGAFLSEKTGDDGGGGKDNLDERCTNPDLLAKEFEEREEALRLAMKQEEELAEAEARGEYNKTMADTEMINIKLAEAGSDPAGIQSPSEEELEVRRMIAEQRELEERGVFDDHKPDDDMDMDQPFDDVVPAVNKDIVATEDEKLATDSTSTDDAVPAVDKEIIATQDAKFTEGLAMLEMAAAAKAEDEARGKKRVAEDIADKDSKIEQQAREILNNEFAKMEDKDRERQMAEEQRIKDLEEGQRMLDMATAARKADTARQMDFVSKGNAEMETDAGLLEDERLQFELEAAQDKFGLSENDGRSTAIDGEKRGGFEESEGEEKARIGEQQKLTEEEKKYTEETVGLKARADLEQHINQEADMFEKERLDIEEKAAKCRAQDERTNRELEEVVAAAKATSGQISEAERAVQLEKKRVELAKAELEADMEMVRRYAEEKKQKEAAAAAKEKAAAAKADAKRIAREKAVAAKTASEKVGAVDTSKAKADTTVDMDIEEAGTPNVWITEEEEEMLSETKGKSKVERKRTKVAKALKKKRVVAAGLAYVLGKRLLNTFLF